MSSDHIEFEGLIGVAYHLDPVVPFGDLLQRRVGDRADQIGRDLDAIEIAQMTDDLAPTSR
jgi:hypothetical protein